MWHQKTKKKVLNYIGSGYESYSETNKDYLSYWMDVKKLFWFDCEILLKSVCEQQ